MLSDKASNPTLPTTPPSGLGQVISNAGIYRLANFVGTQKGSMWLSIAAVDFEPREKRKLLLKN